MNLIKNQWNSFQNSQISSVRIKVITLIDAQRTAQRNSLNYVLIKYSRKLHIHIRHELIA